LKEGFVRVTIGLRIKGHTDWRFENMEKQAVEATINQVKLRIIQGDITGQEVPPF